MHPLLAGFFAELRKVASSDGSTTTSFERFGMRFNGGHEEFNLLRQTARERPLTADDLSQFSTVFKASQIGCNVAYASDPLASEDPRRRLDR